MLNDAISPAVEGVLVTLPEASPAIRIPQIHSVASAPRTKVREFRWCVEESRLVRIRQPLCHQVPSASHTMTRMTDDGAKRSGGSVYKPFTVARSSTAADSEVVALAYRRWFALSANAQVKFPGVF